MTFEEFPISKRKPPSQRPERKLDATAEAISLAREGKKADKPVTPRNLEGTNGPSYTGRNGKIGQRPEIGGRAPSTSSKRPKQPGS